MIIALFIMENRSSGPKKKTTVRKVVSQHPPTCEQRAALKRPSGQQCIGLTCQESCVENAVERKRRRAKEAKQQEKKDKGVFDKCKCFSETLRINI